MKKKTTEKQITPKEGVKYPPKKVAAEKVTEKKAVKKESKKKIAISKKRIAKLWELIKKRIPEEGIKPKERECLDKLHELNRCGYSEAEIVGKFVETIMESPCSYLDIDEATAEKLSAIKGSLGQDYYNIQPRGKRISAQLIEVT